MKKQASRTKPTNGDQPVPPSTTPSRVILHEHIAKRAQEIHLEGGRQEGRAFEDWIQAEKELEEQIRS